MSDWTYNKKANFLNTTNGNNDRETNDFYATDPNSLIKFLERIKQDQDVSISNYLWEPCCGSGTLCDVLKDYGYKIVASDIVDRGYPGTIVRDFLSIDNINFDGDILTNPPYKIALDIIKKSLELVKENSKVIMYLKLTFLEGQERKKFYAECPPKYIYIFSERQSCYINGDFSVKKGSTVCYCWYIWEKGFKGEPIIRWI